jgi:hypothetical protein
LEGGEGTDGVGEGGVQVSEGLGFGSRRRRGDRRRRTTPEKGGAESALGQPKAFPDAEPGAVAESAANAASGGEAVGDGPSEEVAQAVGGEAEAPDFVGQPDAEGAAAAEVGVTVATKDAVGADGGARVAFVVAEEEAVLEEVAAGVAVGARGVREACGQGGPLRVGAVESG